MTPQDLYCLLVPLAKVGQLLPEASHGVLYTLLPSHSQQANAFCKGAAGLLLISHWNWMFDPWRPCDSLVWCYYFEKGQLWLKAKKIRKVQQNSLVKQKFKSTNGKWPGPSANSVLHDGVTAIFWRNSYVTFHCLKQRHWLYVGFDWYKVS